MRLLLTLIAALSITVCLAQTPRSVEVALVDIPAPLALPESRSDVSVPEEGSMSPFRVAGDFLLVEAAVDGAPGFYVLDSGAPGLILNAKPSPTDTTAAATGLNGDVVYAPTQVSSLTWGPLTQTDVTAYAVDLDYLSEAFGIPIAGMLGYDQLRAAPVTIDYRAGTITHHSPHASPSPNHAVRLRMRLRGHVPSVRARIDGRRLRLALDTGAGVNVLDDDRLARLQHDAHDRLDDMILRGLDARAKRVPRTRVRLTEIADANWIGLPFAFADLSGFAKAGLRVDGVLGKEWLQRHVVTLDYGRGVAWVE